jgi:hypothetical protein
MKCTVHPDREATGFCRNCGRPLCPECTREVHGALYCEDCLGKLVAAPPPAEPLPLGTPRHPGVALGLGFIPGLQWRVHQSDDPRADFRRIDCRAE